MESWSPFWSAIWFFLWWFIFIAYLMAIFKILGDLFRDSTLNGWRKALWLLALVCVPFITALVYLIARGTGMAERSYKMNGEDTIAAENYSRSVAHVSPSDEIGKAHSLFSSGAISSEEYQQLKQRTMSSTPMIR